jgi:hypothetical protein
MKWMLLLSYYCTKGFNLNIVDMGKDTGGNTQQILNK